jgi:hypothetical protein
MNIETIAIGKLYDNLLNEGYEIQYKKDYELIIPENLEIHTIGNKYVKLVALSRHKTNKHLIRITCKSSNCVNDVTVTTDHVCMVYNEYNFFENKSAKEIQIGDIVSVYDEQNDKEIKGTITNIEDLGITEDYVYDCEVDDENHSFYCNNFLIHNSQFVNVACVTNDFKKKYNLKNKIADWSNEEKLKFWKYLDDFVENEVNPFVQGIIKEWYHTERPEVLRYSLEYVGDTEVMESKKHYAVHKVLSEGPQIVDKIKYSGIELKKASIPKKIKEYLGEIYNSALTKDWNDNDFKNYILKIYPEFEKLDINDIAIWKGYNTSRQSTGFLKMEKGTTGIAKAATFYNQLISKQGLNIASKYDSIRIGDKVRVCYIKPTNKYNIDVIAFNDGQYPDEFKEIFQVDYEKMFDKLIKSPLKNFLIACKWKMCDPNNCNIMDIDDL